MRVGRAGLAVVACWVAISLQGCGKKPTPSPSPSPSQTTTTVTTTTTTKKSDWNLAPIEVKGNHLYESDTGKQFRAKGIAMPNVGEDVEEWIRVLRRIRNESSEVNMVRLYELPECVFKNDCFRAFMHEADRLGMYVLVPGTGTHWGWLPGTAAACANGTATPTEQGCYEAGGVLGFGQEVVQHFNYPNTLGIVIGNEFDMQMLKFFPIIKAYARDLKSYMRMCGREKDSPTKGHMRMIPLMYASSDDRGNPAFFPKADYLFCGGSDVSLDIIGLNIERWCEDRSGKIEYDNVNQLVGNKSWPGAFVFSEMGCAKINVPPAQRQARSWAQVEGFFHNFSSFDGFVAYTYFGNRDFNMFDGKLGNATMFQDGRNFFDRMEKVGEEPSSDPAESKVPACPAEIMGIPMNDFSKIKHYDTGATGWAPRCPKPYQDRDMRENSVAEFIF